MASGYDYDDWEDQSPISYRRVAVATHRARQEHRCTECPHPIEPGMVYHRLVCVVDECFHVSKSHAPPGVTCEEHCPTCVEELRVWLETVEHLEETTDA